MKTRLLVIIGMIVFTLYGTDTVYGLSCDGTNIAQSFAESDTVFAGQVVSKEYVPSERSSANGRTDALTQFSVIEKFKGISQETISIISSEWLWGYNFTENLEYVVFAYDDGKHLRHQTCTPTSLLEHAELEQIRQVANDLEPTVSDSTLVQVDGDFKKVYYNENEVNFVSFDPYLNSVIFETKGDGMLEIKVPKIYQEGPGIFVLKNGEEIAPVTETSDDCFYYFNIESKVREMIEIAFTGWPGTEKVKGCETFTVSPLQEFKLGISADEIQCRESLIMVTKQNGSPACVKEQTRQKLIERGWALDKSHIPQITDYLKQKSRIIDPEYVRYVETLALEDPIVANFVRGVDWESQCCTYTARNNVDELNIKFVDITNKNFLRITFDLDTLKIINIDTIGMNRIGVGLS